MQLNGIGLIHRIWWEHQGRRFPPKDERNQVDLRYHTLISLINVESMLTDFEKFNPLRLLIP